MVIVIRKSLLKVILVHEVVGEIETSKRKRRKGTQKYGREEWSSLDKDKFKGPGTTSPETDRDQRGDSGVAWILVHLDLDAIPPALSLFLSKCARADMKMRKISKIGTERY